MRNSDCYNIPIIDTSTIDRVQMRCNLDATFLYCKEYENMSYMLPKRIQTVGFDLSGAASSGETVNARLYW